MPTGVLFLIGVLVILAYIVVGDRKIGGGR